MSTPKAARILASVKDHVFGRPSTHDLFNPYADEDPELDQEGASLVRRANLKAYVEVVLPAAKVLVVAEAPGPWGCRFTGVPITSEALLLAEKFPIHGRQTSLKGPYSENSATIFWRVMRPYWNRFIVWNALPLHPHKKDSPLSIRTPRRSEIRSFAPHLAELVDIVAPDRTVALGRVAERALSEIDWPCEYVRHPSQGGARLFAEGMRTLWASTTRGVPRRAHR